MDSIIVEGGKTLHGKVKVSGAKNSALPLLFSTLLAKGTHKFTNVPKLKDIESTIELLKSLQCEIQTMGNEITVKVGEVDKPEGFDELLGSSL